MIKKLHLLLALGFWLFTFTGFAQTYPVTISTQLTQPSPIYLSNYADATTINSPIKVQLVLNDLTISNRQIRLKCYFQGNGISLLTNDFVVGARPLYLEGGFPLQLTNIELAPYFEFQNMLGINPNQYAQALPEGVYTFAVEVYDFATGKKLSRKTSVTTIIFQNDPPFLNLPLNNASIMEQNIQNIVFSWTPRQINVSNVEYEFSLVEIWDKYTPVQNAFAYSPALYTTTTRSTTLQYSNTQPQLIPGKRYAWRIKAKAIFGAEEIGVFKNNGYSEIYSFTYEVFCTAPIAITTESVSQDKAKITWSGDVANYDYQVKYREKNASSNWYDLITPRENITIANLKPNTTYEYTIGASCDIGKYVASSIYEFTTLANDEIAFVGCGIKPDPKDLANKTPLPNLYPNDVVTAGDFPIVVIKATGSNGSFTGEGYVTLPFLEKFKELIDAADALGGEKIDIGKFSRIRITFSNIGVNTDFKLISGEIIASYDKDWGSMADLDPLVNDVFGDNGKVIPFPVDYVIETIVKNPDGSITITGVGGKPVNKIPKNANDYVFTDKEGNQYAVPANAPAGPIEQTGKQAPGGIPTPANTNGMGSGGNIAQITSPDVTVVFSDTKGIYAFDVAPTTDNGTLHKTYETISKKEGTPYRVNYKAISDIDGKNTDSVAATATFSNGKTKDDIVFKTETGTEIKATWSGNIATLTLKKTLDFAKENVIATVRPVKQNDSLQPPAKYDIAGALSLWHLTSKKVNVTFVSVDGYKTPTKEEAEASLNAIYSKAGISFEVSILNKNLNWPSNLQCGNSGVFETYTDDQNKLIAGFESNIGSEYENNTYYLFFSATKPSRSLGGFMPLKRQYGFIFSDTNATEEGGGNTNKTIAHELGHGIFGLQHPFKQYNTPEGSTNLLMDYGTKDADIELSHNDWEIMHAPGLQLYQFTQGSSAGEHRGGGLGITPSNKVIASYPSTYDNKSESDTMSFTADSFVTSKNYAVTGYIVYDENKVIKDTYQWTPDNSTNGGAYKNSSGKVFNVTLIDEGSPYVYKLLEDCFVYYKKIEWKKGNTLDKLQTEDSGFQREKTFNYDGICAEKLNKNIKDTYTNCNLTKEDEGFKKITTIIEDAKNLIEKSVVITTINNVCLGSIRRLKDSEKQQLFDRITVASLDNETEIATLKIMSSMYKTQYPEFIKTLQSNNNEKLIHLIKEIDDKLFFMYGEDNYTDFTVAIAKMVESLSDEIKWNYINILIKERYEKLDIREQEAITIVLSSLKQDKLEVQNEAAFFIEMLKLSPTLINLFDYKDVYLLAKYRSKNEVIFNQFTQTIKEIIQTNVSTFSPIYTTYKVSVGEPNWFSPKSMTIFVQQGGHDVTDLNKQTVFGKKDLSNIYGWMKYLYTKENESILNLLTSEKSADLKNVLLKFKEQIQIFEKEKIENDKNYWANIKTISCDNIQDILDHVRLNESITSLKNVNYETRVSIVENIIRCQARESVSIKDTEESLFKVLRSFDSTDPKILTELEKIGFNTIYENFSGLRLKKFCFWISSQITSSGHFSISQSEKLFIKNNDLISDSSKLIQLEQNMTVFKNTSFDKKSKTTFNVTGFGELNYNEMVPVYIAGSFKYLDEEEFKIGTVAYMPLIQFIAMSNDNTNVVFEKSAWVALDGIFLVIGVGELKYVYTVGNDIHKAIALLEIAGNATSATAQLLNNEAISEEFRFNLQMASLVMNIPSLIGKMPKAEIQAEKLLAKSEKEAISVNDKISYSDYIRNIFKLKQPSTLLERLEKYTLLNDKVKQLGNLEARFMEDFANASEDLLIEMNQTDSKLLSGWKKFRKNNATTILCTQ